MNISMQNDSKEYDILNELFLSIYSEDLAFDLNL